MTYIIKLVQNCSPFEELQSLIKWIPEAVRKMARKCSKSGDYESWCSIFLKLLLLSEVYDIPILVARTRAVMYANLQCVEYMLQ